MTEQSTVHSKEQVRYTSFAARDGQNVPSKKTEEQNDVCGVIPFL